MSKSYAEATAGGGGALHIPQARTQSQTTGLSLSKHSQSYKLQTAGPAIVPADLLTAVKNQGVDSLCLQRQSTGDYLLTFANPMQKQRLLFLGTIYRQNTAYWIDDPDRKVTFVNVFGAPFELSNVVLQAHLRKYRTILSARRGKYHSHSDVENGIRHVRMILRKNIPTTLHVGHLQVSIKYDGQPHTCNKCGEQGHSAVTCRHIRCFSCGEIGHR